MTFNCFQQQKQIKSSFGVWGGRSASRSLVSSYEENDGYIDADDGQRQQKRPKERRVVKRRRKHLCKKRDFVGAYDFDDDGDTIKHDSVFDSSRRQRMLKWRRTTAQPTYCSLSLVFPLVQYFNYNIRRFGEHSHLLINPRHRSIVNLHSVTMLAPCYVSDNFISNGIDNNNIEDIAG